MNTSAIFTTLVLLILSPVVSGYTVQRLDFELVNTYGGGITCEDVCLENLARELGVDVSNPKSIDVSGYVETRGQYTRWRVGNRTGNLGGGGFSLYLNDGTEYERLCEDAGGPYSDTIGADFQITDSRGFELYGESLLCGNASRGWDSFQPASNCEFFCTVRDQWFGDGWDLWGTVTGVSSRVPEPGTFALLVLGLAGVGFTRRKAAPATAQA